MYIYQNNHCEHIEHNYGYQVLQLILYHDIHYLNQPNTNRENENRTRRVTASYCINTRVIRKVLPPPSELC